jgi:uncharacterized membrane protein YfcA
MTGFEWSYILALFIGVSLGLTGGGGSILTVPVLVYIAHIQPILATAYSLFIVGTTSLVGAGNYLRKGLVDVKTAILFAMPSMITVWLVRKFLVHAIPLQLLDINGWVLTRDVFLMLFFAILMMISAFKMIFFEASDAGETKKYSYLLTIVSGLIVGVFSGLVGAGGGFLIVPALVLLMGMQMPIAVGTSLLIIAMNSLLGFTGDFSHIEPIDWNYLFVFSIVGSVGVLLGGYIINFLNADKLKKVFGFFVLMMAVVIIFREICF